MIITSVSIQKRGINAGLHGSADQLVFRVVSDLQVSAVEVDGGSYVMIPEPPGMRTGMLFVFVGEIQGVEMFVKRAVLFQERVFITADDPERGALAWAEIGREAIGVFRTVGGRIAEDARELARHRLRLGRIAE